MKKQELEMAISILQRVRSRYDSLFNADGTAKMWSDDRSNTPTQAAEEIRYARRLLLEVAKEL